MAKRRLNRAIVVAEAAVLVDEQGRDELALGGLAERLGVQPSALYNHVDGIDALRYELAVLATTNLADALRGALVARSGADAVRAITRAHRRFAHEHPGQYASTLLPPEGRGDDLATAQEAVTDLFVLLMESGGLAGDDAVHTARLVRSALHGFVSLESIEALTQPQDRDLSFERLVEMLLAHLPA